MSFPARFKVREESQQVAIAAYWSFGDELRCSCKAAEAEGQSKAKGHQHSISNPACLYVYVCERGCMYDVCIYPKIHTHTNICNISVFYLYCMYVCMYVYVYVSVKIFQDIQTHTDNTCSYI